MPRDTARLERFERATELPMMLLAVALAILLVIPPLADLSPAQQRAVDVAEWLIWATFAVELGIKLYLAPAPLRYAMSHWYDVALVALPFLRPLRLARAFRFARIGSATWRATTDLRRIMRRSSVTYPMAAALLACVVLAATMPLAERDAEGATITGVADGLWWAATTITTVGYGDVSPVTPLGRGLAFALMLVGIAAFGAITASVAAYFVEEDETAQGAAVLAALRDIQARLARLEGRVELDPLTRHAGALTGVWEPNELEDLRNEWSAREPTS
jgi:voltage-gated potassium channel